MSKLLYDAWAGWLDYIYHGKYAALLLLVLMGWWFGRDWGKNSDRSPGGCPSGAAALMIYTTVLTVCCILPPTAALLMQYQTRFYDYQWIWSYVPLTIVLALAATVFLMRRGEGSEGFRAQTAFLAAGLAALICFCGLLHTPVFAGEEECGQREQAAGVLDELAAEYPPEEEICLWAPEEIMASARGTHPEIKLVYGRDMWDAALRAYTYETYSEAQQKLYYWMSSVREYGTLEGYTPEGARLEGGACMEAALAEGVNCLLLPGNLREEALLALEELLNREAQTLEGYYLFVL